MKMIIASLFMISIAQAATFDCTETTKSKKSFGYDGTITVSFAKDGESMDFTVYDLKGKKMVSGFANRDSKFKSKTSARFVDDQAKIGTSDGEAAAFVSKRMLQGKPGRLVVTGNQPNEGDSGPDLFWYTDGEFNCK